MANKNNGGRSAKKTTTRKTPKNRPKSSNNDYSKIPFYRRRWVYVLMFFYLGVLTPLVAFTGNVYGYSEDEKRVFVLNKLFVQVLSVLTVLAWVSQLT